MKGILLASVLWLLVSFLVAVAAGKFIKGLRRKHLSRTDKVPPVSAGAHPVSLADRRAALLARREESPSIPPKEDRTALGLHALIKRYAARIEELETHIAEIRIKLEVTTEASRLLGEEGLSDESSDRSEENRPR